MPSKSKRKSLQPLISTRSISDKILADHKQRSLQGAAYRSVDSNRNLLLRQLHLHLIHIGHPGLAFLHPGAEATTTLEMESWNTYALSSKRIDVNMRF